MAHTDSDEVLTRRAARDATTVGVVALYCACGAIAEGSSCPPTIVEVEFARWWRARHSLPGCRPCDRETAKAVIDGLSA